jgi:type I restriction enzyme R subunit
MSFTEYKTVEKEILDCFRTADLSWRFEAGNQVTANYRAGDEQEMLLAPILRTKLKDLNPGLITSDERADTVISRLRMLRDNREWLSWIRGEQTIKFEAQDSERNVRIVDFANVDANDFLATNQVWIQGTERRRPDILLYLNGIPVVDIEAKTAARGHVDWAEGAIQCARYAREIPQLYASNCFCVGVNELRMKYGIPGSQLQYWEQWRDPGPHTHIPSIDEMKTALYGMFDRPTFLDLIRNFIVFDVDNGELTKKIARYQQFGAANKIVDRALSVSRPREERRGIVWHTQGSGKSLTMIFAARKLWNDPSLDQPTIILVVDRHQLEEQMAGELLRTGTENVVIAQRISHLRKLLRDDYRGVILTIINKFDAMPEEMSTRSNVVMLIDEAHRSQYGDLGTFMEAAVPNASRFGLTGTPLELSDRNTPRVFGQAVGKDSYERYMDRYDIEDSIRDGATKPIHYQVRLTDWTVEYADLDAKFESIFADRSAEERKLLLREAKLDAILKHPERVAQVTNDIAEHFVTKVRPNGFKAMVVCRDREMCALYKVALDAALQQRLGGVEVVDMTRLVISEDPVEDPDLIKQFHLGEDRSTAIEDFKRTVPPDADSRAQPENRFTRTEIVIVCDMLLTGFDAPILQAMYLDKGMRDHTLLQAIARVNRPFRELKQAGLIIDYFGVFEDLNAALNFDKRELGEVAFPVSRFYDMFQQQFAELLDLFAGIPRDGSHSTLMKALVALNDDDDKRECFEVLQRNGRILYETIQPDDFLRGYIADYTWLTKLHMLYRKKFYPRDHFEVTAEDGAKTRALIRDSVDMKALEESFPTYTLDENYLTKIQGPGPRCQGLGYRRHARR